MTFMAVRPAPLAQELFVNGHPLVTIPAAREGRYIGRFPIPADEIAKLTRITVRAAADEKHRGKFNVGPIWLEYHGQKIYDLRFAVFERQSLGYGTPGDKPECNWYFAMP